MEFFRGACLRGVIGGKGQAAEAGVKICWRGRSIGRPSAVPRAVRPPSIFAPSSTMISDFWSGEQSMKFLPNNVFVRESTASEALQEMSAFACFVPFGEDEINEVADAGIARAGSIGAGNDHIRECLYGCILMRIQGAERLAIGDQAARFTRKGEPLARRQLQGGAGGEKPQDFASIA